MLQCKGGTSTTTSKSLQLLHSQSKCQTRYICCCANTLKTQSIQSRALGDQSILFRLFQVAKLIEVCQIAG